MPLCLKFVVALKLLQLPKELQHLCAFVRLKVCCQLDGVPNPLALSPASEAGNLSKSNWHPAISLNLSKRHLLAKPHP